MKKKKKPHQNKFDPEEKEFCLLLKMMNGKQ